MPRNEKPAPAPRFWLSKDVSDGMYKVWKNKKPTQNTIHYDFFGDWSAVFCRERFEEINPNCILSPGEVRELETPLLRFKSEREEGK